jgi:UDP-4-amino-4,6-dideoxy-L-N-acetyl-beta-L-altrosamine transaminase
MKKYISHGMFTKPLVEKKYKWNYYDMDFAGYNFRLSDINCALGITQLDKIMKFIKKRNEIAKFYNNFFFKYKDFISTLKINRNIKSSHHLYPIQIDFKKYRINKLEMLNKLLKIGIRCQIHYKPINHNSFYIQKENLVGSEKYFKNTFSIPIHFNMNLNDAKYVSKNIIKVLKKLMHKQK